MLEICIKAKYNEYGLARAEDNNGNLNRTNHHIGAAESYYKIVQEIQSLLLKESEQSNATPVIEQMEIVQELARESANAHFNAKHEGDWYAHYYGFIYGYQKAESKQLLKFDKP